VHDRARERESYGATKFRSKRSRQQSIIAFRNNSVLVNVSETNKVRFFDRHGPLEIVCLRVDELKASKELRE
jgi:hypothetical protein